MLIAIIDITLKMKKVWKARGNAAECGTSVCEVGGRGRGESLRCKR